MVITDESVQETFSHEDIANMAVTGGANMIQFRDKNRPASELVSMATSILAICRQGNAQFIVNDRVDVTKAVDADGVHLGQRDIPVAAARRLLGPDKLIGGSASTLKEAVQHQEDGADYVGFGHVFATGSKTKAYAPVGLEALEQVVEELSIPVIAIGGMSMENIESVLATGVHGIAVIGTVCQAADPAAAAAAIGEIVFSQRQASHP